MKILYDYQIFHMHKFGGISNCFVQLMSNLPQDIEFELALEESDNIHLKESNLLQVEPLKDHKEDFITSKNFKGKYRLYNEYSRLFPSKTSLGRNRRCSVLGLKRGDYDIFHPTYFEDYFLPYLNGKPFVLSIYDMIAEKFFPTNNMQAVNKRKMVKKASHIVTISDNTKSDIIELLNVPEDKITTIYLASRKTENVSQTPLIRGDYILYVGNRQGYKNFNNMVIHLAPILKKNTNINVVCTGHDFTPYEDNLFAKYDLKGRFIHIRPTDAELMNLYAHALCFIYPSLYEGFGIPILEAYQMKCPVLLNNKSCFPEIAQDAAIYFDLDDINSNLEIVMDRFINISQEERDRLISNQNQRLQIFSWKKSAEQLAEVYRDVLQKSK